MNKPQLFQNIRKILLEEWDPIGIKEIDEAQDEYDFYIPDILKMIGDGQSANDLASYLMFVEKERMGLEPAPFEDLKNISLQILNLKNSKRI